jgi:hypothetical protein
MGGLGFSRNGLRDSNMTQKRAAANTQQLQEATKSKHMVPVECRVHHAPPQLLLLDTFCGFVARTGGSTRA